MTMTMRILGVTLLGVTGCAQMDESTVIYPDGSGKFTMRISVSRVMVAMIDSVAKGFAQQGGGKAEEKKVDLFESFSDPDKVGKASEGFVAWTTMKREEDPAWVRASVTGYFEDINKVTFTSEAKGTLVEPSMGFKHEKTDLGHVLSLSPEAVRSLKKAALPTFNLEGPGSMADTFWDVWDQVKPKPEDYRVSFSVTVPGAIKDAPGFMEVKGRTATISFDGRMILSALLDPEGREAKRLKQFTRAKEIKIAWTESTLPDDEVKAFRTEMNDAKARWEKLREERRKK